MPRPFLTARWHDLALITYAVDPAFAADYLPAGCQLDLVDGAARVSLVAFDFLQTRVLGLAAPFHVNFPEVNLRLYVTRDGVRGVCFVSEFVPRRAIATVARLIYNEPYRAVPMRSARRQDGDTLTLRHALRVGGRWHTLRITAAGRPTVPPADHPSVWLKEHRWGFGQTRRGRPLSYEVVHPAWAIYESPVATLDYDFAVVYGPAWGWLGAATPVSTVLAAGSEVSVWPRRVIG